jgi:hypothetical protein
MLDLDYPALLDLFKEHLDTRRSESASFLIWYLENYYRLDSLEATDSVCDQRGDKGVDGIFVNDNALTITVFQSRISQNSSTTIGDASLREFAGTLQQFESSDAIRKMISSAGTAQVAALAKRLDLEHKINTHELRGEFLSNVLLDSNGQAFLRSSSAAITFVGRDRLRNTYISDERSITPRAGIAFDILGFTIAKYAVDSQTHAIIAPIKATELVKMDGIADQSLYAYNVRGPLGRTQVNKDIVHSVNDSNTHKLFPLFHNGVTVICKEINEVGDQLSIQDYYVVNGCQSLTALYNHSQKLTDDLRILTKFIRTEPGSDLAETITHYSNNQNGVKARDFMSNNAVQIRLQNEMRQRYAEQFELEIKRGERLGSGVTVSNEDAGLLLMAFDLKEPWRTTQKYEVFDERHADLFARPEVTADRIILCWVIMAAIVPATAGIKNGLFGRYLLTRYFLLYCLRRILEADDLSADILQRPDLFVRAERDREHFTACIKRIVDDLIIDLNAELEDFGDDFDYRDKLRNSEWVKDLSKTVVADYEKQVKRGRIQSFSQDWRHTKR